MRRIVLTLLLGLGILSSPLKAQVTTVDFTAADHDAMVGNGGVEQVNFGAQNQMRVFHDASSQIPMVFRSYIQYDLSSIPTDAIIIEAKLKLKAQSVNNTVDHPLYIQPADATWDESTITWNNQPGVRGTQQSIPHADVSATGVHEFDVYHDVQHMVSSPNNNYGWQIRLQQEQMQTPANTGVVYHTAEATNTSDRPVLSIKYMLPYEIDIEVTHCTAGNNDGSFTADLTVGGSYALERKNLYKVVRDTTKLGESSLVNVTVASNLQYSSSTKQFTAGNLEPGIYLLQVLDDKNNQIYASYGSLMGYNYWYIFVGREGEVTSGILSTGFGFTGETHLQKDDPGNSNPLDRDNTNFYSQKLLRIADLPNTYEFASLIRYDAFFDDQLEFTEAELNVAAHAGAFYRDIPNSSNAVNYSIITEFWDEETVTWNTRPSTDQTKQITLAETQIHGWDNTNNVDHVSLIPLVEYWQQNPDLNYGFELALDTYSNTAYAMRSYKPTTKNQHYVEFSFRVKEPVEVTFDEDTEQGTLTVHASAGHPMPYKYLLSYKPLPELSTIWAGIKDSIPVDSATFFAGDVQGISHTFENLGAERYYVGVYDNNGVKIMNGKGIVSPNLTLLDNTNIDLTDGVISKGQSSGSGGAIIDGVVREYESGGFEFEVTELGGNLVFGFNKIGDVKPSTTADFEYSIEIFVDNTYDVLKGTTILYEGSVSLGDIFRIYKQNNEVIFYSVDRELVRASILTADKATFTGAVLVRTPLGALGYATKLDKFVKTKQPLTITPTQLECGDTKGGVWAKITAGYAPGTGTYTIIDLSTGSTVASGDISDLYTGVDLPIGNYKIDYNYTVGGFGSLHTAYFTIGLPIYWNILNEHFEYVAGDVNTIKGDGTLENGEAISQNMLKEDEEGWMYFHTEMQRYYPLVGEPLPFAPSWVRVKMVNQSLATIMRVNIYGLGEDILNKYVWVTDHTGIGVGTVFDTYSNGPFKIERNELAGASGWEYEVSYNNSVTPFATVPEPAGSHQVLKAFPYGANVKIYKSYASFCYGLTTSDDCAQLDYELDGNYYITNNGKFCFKYEEEYNDPNIEFNIYNQGSFIVATQDDFDLPDLVMGENRVVLDLSEDGFCLGEGYYVLEVINDKKEKFYLRFYNDYSGCTPFAEEDGVGFVSP